MYAYDPARAGKLLDEAGYPLKDGKRFSLELSFGGGGTSSGAVYSDAANIIVADWGAIGVEVHPVSLEQNIWLEKVYDRRDFQVSLTSLTSTPRSNLRYRSQLSL